MDDLFERIAEKYTPILLNWAFRKNADTMENRDSCVCRAETKSTIDFFHVLL